MSSRDHAGSAVSRALSAPEEPPDTDGAAATAATPAPLATEPDEGDGMEPERARAAGPSPYAARATLRSRSPITVRWLQTRRRITFSTPPGWMSTGMSARFPEARCVP